MAAATLQKEKDAAAKDERDAKEANKKNNAASVTPKNVDKTIHAKAPTVVSPPSAPDLISLLTSHVGHDRRQPGADSAAMTDIAVMDTGADSATTTDMDTTPPVEDPVDNNLKPPKEKKSKKSKVNKGGQIVKTQLQWYKPQLLQDAGCGSNILREGL
jgi:hypothetical protein